MVAASSSKSPMAELLHLGRLLKSTETQDTLTIVSLFQFMTYAAHLKDDILLVHDATHSPEVAPPLLPTSIQSFLSCACGLSSDTIDLCWSATKDTIWSNPRFSRIGYIDPHDFEVHGYRYGLRGYHF